MKEAEIVFRADGDGKIGLGHVYRCLALAEILSEKYSCAFAIRNPSESIAGQIAKAGYPLVSLPESVALLKEPEYLLSRIPSFRFIILDGYLFDESYAKGFSESGKKIIAIDDMGSRNNFADAIINHAPGIEPERYASWKASLFLGPAYAMLREPFRRSVPARQNGTLDKLLIAFGGADPENFTCKVLSLIRSNKTIKQINVITGSAFQHLTELKKLIAASGNIQHVSDLAATEMYNQIYSADMAIVPSSTLLFEVLSTGTLALSGYYVENQKMIYEGFLASGAIQGLGDFAKLTEENLNVSIAQLRSTEKRDTMTRAMELCFDGKINERIFGIIRSLESAL